MTYNVDELFRFEKTGGGYALAEYLQKDNPKIIVITIPAQRNGKTVAEIGRDAFRGAEHLLKVTVPEGVRRIGENAFQNCKDLRSVSLPASLEELDSRVFEYCEELCEAEFKSRPKIGARVFDENSKLPAELVLAAMLQSFDLTVALYDMLLFLESFQVEKEPQNSWIICRPDVFELAAKNNCFRDISEWELSALFTSLIERGCAEQLRIAEQYDLINPALLEELTKNFIRQGKPEATAYLLDLKNRKYGFAQEEKYEL